jgi:hypothetical protein
MFPNDLNLCPDPWGNIYVNAMYSRYDAISDILYKFSFHKCNAKLEVDEFQ